MAEAGFQLSALIKDEAGDDASCRAPETIKQALAGGKK